MDSQGFVLNVSYRMIQKVVLEKQPSESFQVCPSYELERCEKMVRQAQVAEALRATCADLSCIVLVFACVCGSGWVWVLRFR